jgi:hypothetical protein
VTFTNFCSTVHWTLSSMPVNAADPAANAADGNIASRWSTGVPQAAGQYLQVDFGGTVSLTQVVIDNSNPPHIADYPRGYDVQLSANGTAFTSVKTGVPTVGGAITVDFAAAQGRYLRIVQNGTGAGVAWWSVDEVRVACTVPGKPAGAIDPYDPTNWTATASKSAGGSGPAKAIDGDASTRWATGGDQVGGETFTLDIGAAAMVSELWLDGGGAADFPMAYKLETSLDGAAYTEVATGAGAQLTKIVFTRRNARYFRITQTGTLNKWWSIYAIYLKP